MLGHVNGQSKALLWLLLWLLLCAVLKKQIYLLLLLCFLYTSSSSSSSYFGNWGPEEKEGEPERPSKQEYKFLGTTESRDHFTNSAPKSLERSALFICGFRILFGTWLRQIT